MTTGTFTYQDGDSIRTGQFLIPPSARPDFPSAYCFAFPKSGSVLVNSLAASLVAECRITPLSFPEYLHLKGIDIATCVGDFNQLFPNRGYLFHGFREKPRWMLGVDAIKSAKKLLVVRDPRDMLVSRYFSIKYSHGYFTEHGSAQFNSLIKASLIDAQSDIDAYCLHNTWIYNALLQNITDVADDKSTLILRYEDFIYSKISLCKSICEHLGLEVRDIRIAERVRALDVIPDSDQPLQHVRQVHPGDFRRKLKPQTIDALNSVLGKFLERFGYVS